MRSGQFRMIFFDCCLSSVELGKTTYLNSVYDYAKGTRNKQCLLNSTRYTASHCSGANRFFFAVINGYSFRFPIAFSVPYFFHRPWLFLFKIYRFSAFKCLIKFILNMWSISAMSVLWNLEYFSQHFDLVINNNGYTRIVFCLSDKNVHFSTWKTT